MVSKMFKTVRRESQNYTKLFQKTPNTNEVNKAFTSLSFRGNRGYSTKLMNRDYKVSNSKHKTYGAILRIKLQTGDLYALVQGRYTGKWSFPKGHSNEGESAIKCTLREVGEETGIDKLPEPTEYLQIGYGNYFVFNLEEPIALIPRDTNEIMDTKWVTLEEMEYMSLNADASLYRKQLSVLKEFENIKISQD
jgi:8-oxo-dGTP pyrophosphatase MutT (NUDIX family)